MPVKIYWGPPGSYKTSAAVMDEVARCAREGRHLITNIRGLSEQRIREHAPQVAAGFTMTHLRMDNPDELDRLRKWWHWAPVGAFFVLDEVQAIYPPDWSAAQFKTLSIAEGDERVINGNKFARDLALAFDMHRHGNWDFCFTTPSIKKVIPSIRGAAETAFKHKNLAILGMRGRFMQFMHTAEDNGNPSDTYGSRWRKIPGWVFKCYDSTATGAVSDTRAGWSIFANPRVLLLAGVLVAAVVYLIRSGPPSILGGASAQSSSSAKGREADSAVPAGAVRPGQVRRVVEPAHAPSELWRVVQVSVGPGLRMVYVQSGRIIRRLPGENCEWGRLGWLCRVEDGIATAWTGPEPISDEPPKRGAPPSGDGERV